MNRSTTHAIAVVMTVVCFILFFIGGPGYHASRSFQHFWDTGHIFFFCMLSCLLYFNIKQIRGKITSSSFILILCITLIVGGGVEIIQSQTGRSSHLGDLYRDFLGAFIALFFIIPSRKNINKHLLRLFQLVTIILVIGSLVPLTRALVDENHARKEFPLLSGFERASELKRWEGNADKRLSPSVVFSGKHALQSSLRTTKYSGISLKHFPKNWSDYKYFQFQIFNPAVSKLKITCRIHDKLHTIGEQKYSDRFNQSYTLSTGWNSIRIDLDEVQKRPATRQMDMKQIFGVGIFVIEQQNSKIIYLDDVLLTNG